MGLFGLCGGSNKKIPEPPKFSWEPNSTKIATGTLRSCKDYKNVLHDFNRMKVPVEEYQECAGIFGTGTIQNLGWTNSVEGVHFGSRKKFTGRDRRLKYTKTNVAAIGLYCSYYGEDCVCIDPLAQVNIINSQFKGRSNKGHNGKQPGQDKCIQVDGGQLFLKDSLIENAVRAIRGKANSIIELHGVDFVNCYTAIRGDGLANPREDDPYYNGKAGKCLILVKDCTFYNCEFNAVALEGCEIYFAAGNKTYGEGKRKAEGGKILKGSYDMEQKFWDEVDKLREKSSNEW